MNASLLLWAKALLRLGLVLLALGVVPVLALQFVFPQFEPLVPVLLSITVAPLGALVLLAAIILFLAALVRRRPGSS